MKPYEEIIKTTVSSWYAEFDDFGTEEITEFAEGIIAIVAEIYGKSRDQVHEDIKAAIKERTGQ